MLFNVSKTEEEKARRLGIWLLPTHQRAGKIKLHGHLNRFWVWSLVINLQRYLASFIKIYFYLHCQSSLRFLNPQREVQPTDVKYVFDFVAYCLILLVADFFESMQINFALNH